MWWIVLKGSRVVMLTDADCQGTNLIQYCGFKYNWRPAKRITWRLINVIYVQGDYIIGLTTAAYQDADVI